MSFKLRPYQEDIIAKARDLMASGVRKILIQAPTGSGKTALTAHMIRTAASRQMTSWFVVHRLELIKQSSATFESAGVAHGIISGGFHPNAYIKTQVCNVASLRSRYVDMKPPQLIVWDECHHQTAGTWDKIFKAFPNTFHVGLTATPCRLDGTGLNKHYDQMINGPSVRWLIDNDFLCDYKLYAPSTVNLTGIHSRMGDFVKSEISELMDKPTITGNAITEYERKTPNSRAVVFAVTIKHSQHIAAEFMARGVPAAHIDGTTPQVQRDYLLDEFRAGRILVLSNVDLFGEGFDLPSLETVIMLRPTRSLGLYLQQVGRSLRPSPGKTHATILDHVGNCERHGLPDEDREWTLEGKTKRAKPREDAIAVKICPGCFAAQPSGGTSCIFCGYAFEIKEREIIQEDGDLVEVDKDAIKKSRRQQQGNAQSLQELVELGKSRGYKRPHLWAKQVFNGRQRKKIRGG